MTHCVGQLSISLVIFLSLWKSISPDWLDVNHSIPSEGKCGPVGAFSPLCLYNSPLPHSESRTPAVVSDNKTSRQEDFTTVPRSYQVTVVLTVTLSHCHTVTMLRTVRSLWWLSSSHQWEDEAVAALSVKCFYQRRHFCHLLRCLSTVEV